MIDFKMTDIDGRWRHITIPVERFGEDTFTYGTAISTDSTKGLTTMPPYKIMIVEDDPLIRSQLQFIMAKRRAAVKKYSAKRMKTVLY